MNTCIIMGRLVREPEARETQSGMTVTRYTLAVDRRGKKQDGQQTADFIPCVAFDKAADFAGKYFHQGMRVLVRGRIQTGSYTSKTGTKVYTTEIMVDDQEFADGKRDAVPAAAPAPKGKPEQMGMEEFMKIPEGADDAGLPWNM